MGDHTDHWSRNSSSRESYLLHLSLTLTFFWQHSVLLAFQPYLEGCQPQMGSPLSRANSLLCIHSPLPVSVQDTTVSWISGC